MGEKLRALDLFCCAGGASMGLHRAGFEVVGTMFGLRVIRHRLFETSFLILFTPECGRHGTTNSHRGYSTGGEFITVAGNNYRRVEGAAAMDIDWHTTRQELSQAIPPAYSEFIGKSAIAHINSTREAAA